MTSKLGWTWWEVPKLAWHDRAEWHMRARTGLTPYGYMRPSPGLTGDSGLPRVAITAQVSNCGRSG
jgi:hypothetical protein